MTTAGQILGDAASYIGVSGTDNIFNTWYWGYHCYDPNTYPWCAAFQSYVACHDCGMDATPSASAAGFALQFPRVADEDVQPGDYVLFNWDGRQDFSWADHIGVVEWSDINGSGYFGTIEGNTGGGEGEVARCTRYNWGSYATAFYRPYYDGSEPGPSPEPEPSVEAEWQGDMIGFTDQTGSDDDFAGVPGRPIIDIAIDRVGDYQVSDIVNKDFLPVVNHYDLNDPEYGYAGDDHPIDRLRIFDPNIRYQLRQLNGEWHDVMQGLEDLGGSGDDFAGESGVQHDLLRIWRINGGPQPRYNVKS